DADHGDGLDAEEADEAIAPEGFRLAVLAVAVDGRPVLGAAVGALGVVVAPVVVHVVVVVQHVRHAEGDGFEGAVGAVDPGVGEVGVVDEVVRDALQVPAVRPHDSKERDSREPPRQRGEGDEGVEDEYDDADAAEGGEGVDRVVAEEGAGHGDSFLGTGTPTTGERRGKYSETCGGAKVDLQPSPKHAADCVTTGYRGVRLIALRDCGATHCTHCNPLHPIATQARSPFANL